MEETISSLLPFSISVALSPMPIAALILMLLSKRAKVNSIMFLAGWILGLYILVVVVSNLLSGYVESPVQGFSTRKLIDLLLGLLLILFSVKQFKSRPKKGKLAKIPKWMEQVESFSPTKAFGIGFLLATLNLKNTPMGIAAGTVLSHAGSESSQVMGMISYLVIGASTIIVPVLAFLLLGRNLKGILNKLKGFLIQKNAIIMFVLFLVLGLVLISKAFR